MNRQPFQTPPCWWSPCLSARWMRLWRPMRRLRGMRHHGLSQVEVRGLEHVRGALDDGDGVLITPNHPTHADPFVLVEASEQLGTPFYFMTAWQVFAMTHRLGRRVLRQHGCFSINREGHDLPAFRQAVGILEDQPHPLVVFPEGEVFHLNDRVMPFRRGAATMALRAARRRGRPIAIVPCGMKFLYVTDPTPGLLEVMDRLERHLSLMPRPETSLARRIHRAADEVLHRKELEHLGGPRTGSLRRRSESLLYELLDRLERRYGAIDPCGTVPERVKQLRRRVIAKLESAEESPQRDTFRRDLDELFLVMQLFSYPTDYLIGQPSLERLAETLDKLEEDVLGVRTAGRRGICRAVLSFGEPVHVGPFDYGPGAARELTERIQSRVQRLVDEINASACDPVKTRPATADRTMERVEPALTMPLAG